MEQIPCNVVKDLLILYDDDVCSQETKELVEEHIKTCGSCQSAYEDMQKKLPEITEVPDELVTASRLFKKIKRSINIRQCIIILIILTLLFTAVLVRRDLSLSYTFLDSKCINVSEVYQLKNGDIFCTLECYDDFNGMFTSGINEPKDKKPDESFDNGHREISFSYSLYDKYLEQAENQEVRQSFVYRPLGRLNDNGEAIILFHF